MARNKRRRQREPVVEKVMLRCRYCISTNVESRGIDKAFDYPEVRSHDGKLYDRVVYRTYRCRNCLRHMQTIAFEMKSGIFSGKDTDDSEQDGAASVE